MNCIDVDIPRNPDLLSRANHLKYRLTPALALTLFGKEGTRKAQEIV
jgi:hypothetical protein